MQAGSKRIGAALVGDAERRQRLVRDGVAREQQSPGTPGGGGPAGRNGYLRGSFGIGSGVEEGGQDGTGLAPIHRQHGIGRRTEGVDGIGFAGATSRASTLPIPQSLKV